MTVFILLFFILLVTYGYLINRYSRGWEKLPLFTPDKYPAGIYLSVVIAARNEQENIPLLITSLIRQSYPSTQFEVIIVNDHSTDHTWEEMQKADKAEINLTCINLEEEISAGSPEKSSKKNALRTGIEHAKGEVIVTTDADCIPHIHWLKNIAACYQLSDAVCVAGPVKIISDGSFFSVFQSLDFLTLQGITGAAIFNKQHVLANGANFSYKKAVYHDVGGFSGIDSIPSGDDILLMQKINKKYPDKIYYLKSNTAIVATSSLKTWRAFFQQRIRWASKSGHYDNKRLLGILLVVWLFNLCFFILALASVFNPYYLFLLVLFVVAKLLIDYPFVHMIAKFFEQQKLMRIFPLPQPIHIFYTVIAGLFGQIGSYTWKDRKVNRSYDGRK